MLTLPALGMALLLACSARAQATGSNTANDPGRYARELVQMQLRDTSMIRRYVAHDRLRRAALPVKRAAARQLAEALTDTSRLVRSRALTALEGLGPEAAQAIPAITDIIANPRDPLRISAFHSFSRMGMGVAGQPAADALRRATLEPAEVVVSEAVEGLLAVGDTVDAIPVLHRLLSSDTDFLRLGAARALVRIGDSAGIAALQGLLSDTALFRRTGAALLLGDMGPAAVSAVPALVAMLNDTIQQPYPGRQRERPAPFAAKALAEIMPFAGAPIGIPLRVNIEGSSNSLRDDGLGVYAWGVDSVFAVMQGGIAFMLASDNSPRGPLSPEQRQLRRFLSFDLSRPVPRSGSKGLGVIRDNEAQIHIWLDPRTNRGRSLNAVPISDSVRIIDRIEMHFRINGALHILQVGPFTEGQMDAAWFSGINGDGT